MSARAPCRGARLSRDLALAFSGRRKCGRAADELAQPPDPLEDFGFGRGEGKSDVTIVAECTAGHERDTGLGEQFGAERVRPFELAREILVDAEEEVERA